MPAAIRKLIVKPFGVIVNSDRCQRSCNRPIIVRQIRGIVRFMKRPGITMSDATHACKKYPSGSVQAPLSPRKRGTICSRAFANVQYCAVHFYR